MDKVHQNIPRKRTRSYCMNASNLYIKAFRTAREVQSNSRAQTLCQFVRCF